MTASRAALAVFTLVLAVAAWALGDGAAGWLYLLVYGLAVLPGLPIGFALFGRDHAGGWIAGVLIGYALASMAIWLPIAAGVPSRPAFIVSWAGVAAAVWFLAPRDRAVVELPRWTPAASASLLLVLVLTVCVAAPPLANVGRADAAGNRYYRAYFTADFVWHMALTAEIAKFSMPPRNPYLSHRPIHYYWTYYLVPAAVSAAGPSSLADVARVLKLNALMTGLLLMSAVFLSAWAAVGRPVPVAAAASLVLVASSAEGIFAVYRLWSRGQPMGALRDLNIDAISNWWFGGHRIDGLQRCLWYVPQHAMAYSLGLVALAVAASAGSTSPVTAILLTGIALGCSVAFNPLVGGLFALAYGVAVALDAVRHPGPARSIARHALAVLPVAAAIAWCFANRMVEGAGGVLQFGLLGASRQHPIVTLLLSLGPVLAVGIAGLLPSRAVRLSPLAPSAVLAGVSLAMMYLVRLSVDQAWVAFRAGQMMLVALAAAVARFIAVGWETRRALTAGVLSAVLVIGLPTLAIDEYNAQDIHNTAMGTGFPWTIVISAPQQRAFAWIRDNTPRDAVVQMEPEIRGRATWSLIPSFAGRRMTAGLPISLMDVPEFHERSDRVRAVYQTASAVEASQIARTLRIDYLYVDDVERRAYPGAAKFDGSPSLFERVFADSGVSVYRVR